MKILDQDTKNCTNYKLDNNSNQRQNWNSYWGFLFASIGSAVGIGNIWRFPYLVGKNGGGAFLIPYLVVMVSFGLGYMMIELAVGRYYNTSIIGCLTKINKKFKWIGIFTVSIATIVLSYYLVILGWILSFLVSVIIFPDFSFDEYVLSLLPVLSFFIIVGINFIIVKKGISKGIERLNKIGVIILIALIIPLTIYGLTLPNSEKGVEYYLTPDFSRFSDSKLWTSVFGQVFFSLSIGFGTLVAYGSYLRGKQSILKSSSIIVIADVMISVVAGFMIFTLLFSFNMEPTQGVSLIFQVMPNVFSEMDLGFLIGPVFFALLLVAGLTSSIGLFQVPISAMEDSLKFSRNKAVLLSTIIISSLGIFSALSYSQMDLRIFDLKILDFMNELFGTYGLSVSAVLFVVVVLWFMKKKYLLINFSTDKFVFPNWIYYLMKFMLPTIIIVTIVYNILIIINK